MYFITYINLILKKDKIIAFNLKVIFLFFEYFNLGPV